MTTTDDARSECVGPDFAGRASLPESGLMRFVRSDSSSACSPVPLGRIALEQVLPNSYLSELAFSTEPGWEPLSDETVLYGVWMAEGGQHVLEMDPSGAYYVMDESTDVVDQGQWSLQASDLTLTSWPPPASAARATA